MYELVISLPKQIIKSINHYITTYKYSRYCHVDAHIFFTGLGEPGNILELKSKDTRRLQKDCKNTFHVRQEGRVNDWLEFS